MPRGGSRFQLAAWALNPVVEEFVGVDDAAIVAAVLSIARQLELNVVAEGVETFEQRDFLREHLCPEIQGFLYSQPVPAEELATILTRGVCRPKALDE